MPFGCRKVVTKYNDKKRSKIVFVKKKRKNNCHHMDAKKIKINDRKVHLPQGTYNKSFKSCFYR